MRFRNLKTYIGFNDRWFMAIGIPLTTIFTTLVYHKKCPELIAGDPLHYFGHGLIFTIAYWLLNRAVMIILRRKFPEIRDTAKRLGLHVAIAIATYPIVSVCIHAGVDFTHSLTGGDELPRSNDLVSLLTIFLVIFMIMSIYEGVYFFKRYKGALIAQQQIKTEHVSTQLTNLRNQVNPHFLFNSLNTLMSLIPGDAKHAHQYLSKLSSFYRYSVSERDGLLIPLQKELEVVRLYSDLVKERFGEGIRIDISKVQSTASKVLPMTLQLLVENAVKHNIVSRDNPLRVHVYEKEGYLHVENPVQPRITETSSTGMGLKNIRERYGHVTEKEVKVSNHQGQFRVSIPLIKQIR